jgi:hypothetical protein
MKIIVHGGQAHRDEVVAVSLILVYATLDGNDVQVFRRDPTPEELDDPEAWVVDVGMRHEPQLHNFDHHQLPRDAAPTCAMSLVAEHLGLDGLLSRRPWYRPTVVLDAKGPFALAAEMKLPPSAVSDLWSPVEQALVGLFEEAAGTRPVDAQLVNLLRRVGAELIEEARTFTADLDEVRASTVTARVGGVAVMITTELVSPPVAAALRREISAEKPGAGPIGIGVSWDDRGQGFTLYRFEDDPRVDLNLLGWDPRITFAHVGGFVAKTATRLPVAEVIDLLEGAIVHVHPDHA